MYSGKTIGNFFIEQGIECGRMLTPMQVVKLVYISHGWNLALTGKPLIDEGIQAWKYGPVVPGLYQSVKIYGDREIPNPDYSSKYLIGEREKLRQDRVLEMLLITVYERYKHMDGLELSALTHQHDTPWHRVWVHHGGSERLGAVIPNIMIREYYESAMRVIKGNNSGDGSYQRGGRHYFCAGHRPQF